MSANLKGGFKVPCKLKSGWFWAFLTRTEKEGSGAHEQTVHALVAARGPVLKHSITRPDINPRTAKLLDYRSPQWACKYLSSDNNSDSLFTNASSGSEQELKSATEEFHPTQSRDNSDTNENIRYADEDVDEERPPETAGKWHFEGDEERVANKKDSSGGEKYPRNSDDASPVFGREQQAAVSEQNERTRLIDELARQIFEFTTFEVLTVPPAS